MKRTKAIYICAMLIFGSIGLFVKSIPLPSAQIAFVRGFIGSLFLLGACPLMKQRVSYKAIKANLLLLILSGSAIGFNWILLFQAYKYTSIANATLSYYFAPVFIMLLSPFLLKEKIKTVRVICITAAVVGMFCVVGNGSDAGQNNFIGICYGLSAAVLYASVVIMNKHLKGLSGIETTFMQLSTAFLVLLPYILTTEKFQVFNLNSKALILLIVVGIIHTGLAYLLYFTAVRKLSGQTIAVFSYLDPISAVIMSWAILGDSLSILQLVGGLLILGATLFNELYERKKPVTE